MFYVEIHEYDYFIGNRDVRFGPYEKREEAMEKYNAEKRNDFDYGDHYRVTNLRES